MFGQIVVEAETPGDSAAMFRLRVDGNVIAERVTGSAGSASCLGNP